MMQHYCSSSNQIAAFWLLLMTVNNIGVTIINKALFSIIHFPYPYMLTVIHMAITYLACQYIFYTIQQSQQQQQQQQLKGTTNKGGVDETKPNFWIHLLGASDDLFPTTKSSSATSSASNTTTTTTESNTCSNNNIVMLLYSLLFSMNIAIGNVSLQYVSINFNQVMRSLVPIITLYCTYYSNMYCNNRPTIISVPRQIAVYIVVLGVAISTIGDRMHVTIIGFIYTLLCVILAAIKVVASSELLTGTQLKLHPLRLLHRMAPLAFIQCLFMSIVTGEVRILYSRWYIDIDPITTGNLVPITVLIFSGILAFSLNICALQAYKVTSPVTCCIAAAVKQVLMVVIGTLLFHTSISILNGLGILVVLIASTYYSYISITEPKVAVSSELTNSNQNENGMDSADHKSNSNCNNLTTVDEERHVRNDEYPSMLNDDEIENVNISSSGSGGRDENNDDDDRIELGAPLLQQRRSPPPPQQQLPSSTTTQRRTLRE